MSRTRVLRLSASIVSALAATAQAHYIGTVDSHPLLSRDGVPALFPSSPLMLASCAAVAFVAVVILWPEIPLILRSALFGSLAALASFEIVYAVSRLPAISPVSLSLALRPMSCPFSLSVAVFFFSALCCYALGDAERRRRAVP